MNKVARFYVGIDLHQSSIQICVLDRSGKVIAEDRYQGRDLASGLAAVADLERWGKGGRFAVEALGLNRWFVNACHDRGLDIVVVDPAKLHLKREGKKTDRRDALEIARRLYLGDIDRHATTYYPTEQEYGARKVVRTRHKLVGIRQQLVNQIRSLLNAYRIGPLPGLLYSKKNLARLRRVLFADNLQECLLSLLDCLEAVQVNIEILSSQIQKLAQEPSVAQVQEVLPSVGSQTAVTLVCELGDVSRFHNSPEVASYAGLVPRVAQSGDKSHHGRLTKRGNKELRWILGQWAVRLLSRNPLVQAWAQPKRKRIHKNKIRTALARRLLIGLYVMLSRGEVFSLRKCLGM